MKEAPRHPPQVLARLPQAARRQLEAKRQVILQAEPPSSLATRHPSRGLGAARWLSSPIPLRESFLDQRYALVVAAPVIENLERGEGFSQALVVCSDSLQHHITTISQN